MEIVEKHQKIGETVQKIKENKEQAREYARVVNEIRLENHQKEKEKKQMLLKQKVKVKMEKKETEEGEEEEKAKKQ